MTGEKPKVMSILPFGCLTYAVKPRVAFSKTNMDPRAWVGSNLGRSTHTPGAYNIWVPALSKVVCTSEVYFDEGYMPWRPKGDRRIGEPLPSTPPDPIESDKRAVVAEADLPTVDMDKYEAAMHAEPTSAAEAFDRATRTEDAVARRSNKILLLFSGPYNRPDGLAALLNKLGFEVVCLDNDPTTGGGAEGDILNDDVHNHLLQRIVRGEFFAIFAAPPCSTFSVSRHFAARGARDGGPPLVRNRQHIRGLPDVPTRHRRELLQANAVVARMAALIMAGFHRGVQFVVENPADRGDSAHPRRFLTADHGPLWLMPELEAIRETCAGKEVTFAMCNFGAPWQKYTTLAYSSGLSPWLAPLSKLQCGHASHPRAAGGAVGDGGVPSAETSAYPSNFNQYMALALASLRRESTASPPPGLEHANAEADAGETPDPALRPTELPPAPPRPPEVHEPRVAEAPAPAGDGPPAGATAYSSPFVPSGAKVGTERPEAATRPARSPIKQPVFETGGVDDDFDMAGPVSRPVPQARKRQATRATRPTLASGLGDSTGWVALMRAATVASMATGSAGFAALAKPGSADPKGQAEAYSQDKAGWRASEAKELKNHEDNGSWEMVDRSEAKGRNLVKLIWVYKVKRDGKLKSRLCVQGCRQVKGIDYDQTWCGTMRGASLRALSAIAARASMRMRRWDFVSAYLQGELEEGEVVYCFPPPGYPAPTGSDGREQLCKVMKPIYGMAQAGRRWQRTLYPWFTEEMGFTQCPSDSNVFVLERDMPTPNGSRHEKIIVGTYVDDLCTLYTYDDEHSLYALFAKQLQERFSVEDEGDLHDLLGIEFRFESDGCIVLHQQTYVEKLAADFFPDGVPATAQANKPPCDTTLPLHVAEAMSLTDEIDGALLKRYQSLVGALLYCSGNTRPDVAFAVGMLCRAMSRPTPELHADALRVLGYLYRNRHLGLRYQADQLPLAGQSDSDWSVKHSTTGWHFTYSQAVISWGSKKQNSVALSSCEAEIMAASEAAKEGIYLRRFLGELGVAQAAPTEMGMDNQAAIAISYNPELHSRTKHIDRRHFFVRECVENLELRVPFVGTADNAADFFTKPLPAKTFYAMRNRLMNIPRDEAPI